ncbi:hypothetical protein FOA52_016040 [Chlamydomonas sp. UWO 241]|nr:hypothetical protein FOA52_016040 [Chlamydomonas sp. UWO 241]
MAPCRPSAGSPLDDVMIGVLRLLFAEGLQRGPSIVGPIDDAMDSLALGGLAGRKWEGVVAVPHRVAAAKPTLISVPTARRLADANRAGRRRRASVEALPSALQRVYQLHENCAGEASATAAAAEAARSETIWHQAWEPREGEPPGRPPAG